MDHFSNVIAGTLQAIHWGIILVQTGRCLVTAGAVTIPDGLRGGVLGQAGTLVADYSYVVIGLLRAMNSGNDLWVKV